MRLLGTSSELDELALLSDENLAVDGIGISDDLDLCKTAQKVDRRSAEIVRVFVSAALRKNSAFKNPTLKTIHDLTRLDYLQTTRYFRAGKTYLRITHNMGSSGNLFFVMFFDELLGHGRYSVSAHDDYILVIYRV